MLSQVVPDESPDRRICGKLLLNKLRQEGLRGREINGTVLFIDKMLDDDNWNRPQMALYNEENFYDIFSTYNINCDNHTLMCRM